MLKSESYSTVMVSDLPPLQSEDVASFSSGKHKRLKAFSSKSMNPPATHRSLKPVQSKLFIYQVEVLLSSYKDIKSTPVCFSAYNAAEVLDDLGYYGLAMS